MGDRAYVTTYCSVDARNPLSAQEEWAFQNLTNGEMPDVNDLGHMQCAEDNAYGPGSTGSGVVTHQWGQEEVGVGYIDGAAQTLVEHMRAGLLPKRSFEVSQDGAYGGDMGWAVHYDADTDRVARGNYLDGSFQLSLGEIISLFEAHHRDAAATLRAIFEAHNVVLLQPPSPVIALIEQLNKQHSP
jgi:hypothetical protein